MRLCSLGGGRGECSTEVLLEAHEQRVPRSRNGEVGGSGRVGESFSSIKHKQKKSFWPNVVLQDLSFFVTEMPAEQLKRKVTWLLIASDLDYFLCHRAKNLSRLSHGFEASPTIQLFLRPSAPSITTPPKGSSRPMDYEFSKVVPRFDDYSFYYDEYLDMEECWEESDQVPSRILILMYFF